MKKLTENIKNTFGDKGLKWILELSTIINTLAHHWQLTELLPVDNMTFNYVAKALSHSNQPVVLKISCDAKSITEEKRALLYFNGHAAVRLIDYNDNLNALLLEQAIPGNTLKALYSGEAELVMDCYLRTMRKLHSKHISKKHNYRRISDWLKIIDKLMPNQFPHNVLNHAICKKNQLLNTLGKEIFLHGDLHHDNIIKNKDEWITIDPKGIVGEQEFEIAAFDFMHGEDVSKKAAFKSLYEARVKRLAEKANLDPSRLHDWVFVRLILIAAWQIEDNIDPSWAINFANTIM